MPWSSLSAGVTSSNDGFFHVHRVRETKSTRFIYGRSQDVRNEITLGTTPWERSTSSRDERDILLEGLDEPLETENLGINGLDYNTTGRRRGRDRRERNGCGRRRSCKASQQHRVNHKGNGEEDRRSERIGGKKKTHPYEKQEMRSVLLQFVPYKNRNGERRKD